jgi:hypothetical protein
VSALSYLLTLYILIPYHGGVAQMVERSLSMREAQGSIPCSSTFFVTCWACSSRFYNLKPRREELPYAPGTTHTEKLASPRENM